MTDLRSFVGYYESVMPRTECLAVLASLERRIDWRASTFATHDEVVTGPTRVAMTSLWVRRGDDERDVLQQRFEEVILAYRKEHADVAIEHVTDFRVNRYRAPGGFMSRHIDNIHHSHGQSFGYPLVSVLLFLNDDYEGGELVFRDGEMVFEPRQGSAIVFPATFMFPHEVKPVRSGARYSVNAWLL